MILEKGDNVFMRRAIICITYFCLMMFCAGLCNAANFVQIPVKNYEFSGSVKEIAPFAEHKESTFSGDWLGQKVSILSDGTGTYQIVYFMHSPSLYFTVDKSVGLIKIDTTGTRLQTPDGDDQQDAAIAKVEHKQIVIKIVKDIKLNYGGNNKATRLVKSGSYFKFILK